jgi:hypothetical protein
MTKNSENAPEFQRNHGRSHEEITRARGFLKAQYRIAEARSYVDYEKEMSSNTV